MLMFEEKVNAWLPKASSSERIANSRKECFCK